ncbi:MAG: BON domain-containing protein [Planctomycetaceae bacterium]|nr:BON domain-containing protein [Planctomycetaceae bacterium]
MELTTQDSKRKFGGVNPAQKAPAARITGLLAAAFLLFLSDAVLAQTTLGTGGTTGTAGRTQTTGTGTGAATGAATAAAGQLGAGGQAQAGGTTQGLGGVTTQGPGGSGVRGGNAGGNVTAEFVGGNNAGGFVGGAQNTQNPSNRQFRSVQNTGVPSGSNQPAATSQPRRVPTSLRVGFSVPSTTSASHFLPAPKTVQVLTELRPEFGSVTMRMQTDGTLTLVGSVPNAGARRLAANMARLTPGVTGIDNRLSVSVDSTGDN